MDRKDFPNLQSRRSFIRQAACAAVGTFSLANAIRDLRLINTAAGQTSLSDYKALVCIFLAGGNDANNLIIPMGADYANYATIRQNLALPEASLLGLSPVNSDGHSYGLHPSCGKLQALFNGGKLATLFNVGPLVYPLTRSQYQAGSVPKPPQLFSHSDQVTHWQTSIPDQIPKTGWGGRMADLMHPLQLQLLADGTPAANSAKISLCTSLAGANTFEVGNTTSQYAVSTTGAVTLSGMSTAQTQALRDIINVSRANLQEKEYGKIVSNALDIGATLNNATARTRTSTDTPAGTWVWSQAFPTSSLGTQLKMIARLIDAGRRSSSDLTYPGLDMKRQIFFASVGGYDTHTAQITTPLTTPNPLTGSHANLLAELSDSMYAFQKAMEQLGMDQSVTTFTASDFGRTFPTNGQGSDHGWGSHHLVMGGAVRGQNTYGIFPVQQVNGPDDTSTGRWIPRVSVDQYSATLARWFGVSAANLSTIFPNIGRFAQSDLGFMM